ncbi:hypothetical protein Leryth_013484 [Lithospermum erythrorhizon]|nr:hypothetical protein Leryth_013484 [Lithospermum erythrorhizon]
MEMNGGGGNGKENKSGVVMEHLMRATKWTDEKHGLYLNSMEASFVNQLHDSIDILGWTSQKHTCYGQFKVFRQGWRGNIKFSRDEAELNNGDESGVDQITSNPWIRRYSSECRQHTRRPAQDLAMTDEFRASAFYARHRLSNRPSSAPSLEVTDQNFIDEDTKDESECEIQCSKRIKTEGSSNED